MNYTRQANDLDLQRYALLCATSTTRATALALALRFYRNGHAFLDDEHAEAHRAACLAWNAELSAAGFEVTERGLRVTCRVLPAAKVQAHADTNGIPPLYALT